MTRYQWKMKTGLVGDVYLIASDKGLCGIYWSEQNLEKIPSLSQGDRAAVILTEAVKQLKEYFSGQRKKFKLPLDIQGTDFQRKVWNQLARIPYGQTCSYTDVACRIEQNRAVRAVGTANGRNPLSIVVPCHRVIAADGSLGGYAGGLPIKIELLRLEGAWSD